jgi:hypothetical protein
MKVPLRDRDAAVSEKCLVLIGATYYLQTYQGFYAVAILMLVCVGANLVAGILAIIAGKKLRHWSSAK